MIYFAIRIGLCFLSLLCFSIGISFLWRIKKLVRQNLGKSLSRSDYMKTQDYLTKYRFYVYIVFFTLAFILILIRFN
ncbi:hypothetical protein FDP51_00675 [Enterococcus mundtii]|uniref:Uncharacterized protein n=1 Tax=Enterococcus mundtii TaxID=53346 RepID=A0A1V2UJR9_ENTMU|nr:hypothetical protein [Enterococcus mundtii]ONN43549.1 hypothetical protein BTN92_06890 [Enterococcus mundtii]PJK26753.1 hypothetical protein CV769_03405 [Enterococcus mundtii]QCJ56627.1 hypothetical protein DDJ96_08410 [Enterococcus mundtii]